VRVDEDLVLAVFKFKLTEYKHVFMLILTKIEYMYVPVIINIPEVINEKYKRELRSLQSLPLPYSGIMKYGVYNVCCLLSVARAALK
jgi:hypothetical protein